MIYVKGNQSFVRYNISSESRFTSNTKVNVKQNNLIWSLNQTWFNDIAPIIIKNPRLFLFLRPELRKTWACAVCMCVQSLIWIIPNWNFFSLDQADFPWCMLYERIWLHSSHRHWFLNIHQHYTHASNNCLSCVWGSITRFYSSLKQWSDALWHWIKSINGSGETD